MSKEYTLKLPVADENNIMHFGKYKGQPISQIPASYLIWIWNAGMKAKTKLGGEDGAFARYIKKERFNLEREERDTVMDKEV